MEDRKNLQLTRAARSRGVRERSEVRVLQLFAIAFVQLRDKKFVL